MKKTIWVLLALMVLGSIAQAADTVLLTDDFQSSTLDASKWTLITGTGHDSFDETSAGSSVALGTYLWLKNTTAGAGGAYKSKLLAVDGRGEIVIWRKNYVDHKNGTLVSMPDEVVAEDGTVLLRWGYHNYNDGSTSRYGFGGFGGPETRVTGAWSTFFNETITYDPVTGQGSYSLNGGTPVSISGIPFPDGATNLYVRGSAYGEGSLEYWKAIDDFSISQTDRKLLTVSSPYGSPVPDIGTNAFETGSTVTCSVANVESDGVTYECTGWSGVGSVPLSGTTNTVIFTLTEDSSIRWKWKTPLLNDDFSDGILDTSKWTHIHVDGLDSFYSSPGSSLLETNDVMRITHSMSDNGGAFKTALLPINDQGQIFIERRTKVHAAYETAQMPENLMSEGGTILLSWGYYKYNYWYSVYGFGGLHDVRVDGLWDEWFDETITYDPITGHGTYSLNGSQPILITGTAIPSETTNVYLRGCASGAYLGHTKEFDDFSISQGEPANQSVLTINSTHGSPNPAAGSFIYGSGTSITCFVESIYTNNGSLYQCTGWIGTGSVPSSGTTNTTTCILDEDSSITWNWQTNKYQVTIHVEGNGSVNLNNGYYEVGSMQTLIATPDAGSWFAGWSGDASGTNDASITMNAPKTVTATFRDAVLQEDDFNGGLLNTSKWTVIRASDYGFDSATAGNSLTVSNGIMNITHAVANSGGAFQTGLLPVSDRGLIIIERRTKVHSAGTPRMLELLKSESGTTLLYWQYTGSGFGYGASFAAGVWDEWFDETITYDPITGESTISINGGTPVAIVTGEAMPANTTHVYLQGGAAGDGTGYTKQFDTFNISQGEDSSRAVLTVRSTWETPVPSTGVTVYDSGSTVTCSVESASFDGSTHYQCTGWSGSGSVPASGAANSVVVTLDEDSAITWNWQAADHWLAIGIEGNGSVNLSNGFYVAESAQNLVATPDAGWVFNGWRGDAFGIGDATVTMNEPKSVTAVFFCPPPVVTATVAQVEGTRDVEISCDVAEGGQLLVDVEVYQNGTNLNAASFSGAGMVNPGTNQVITWHAGTDWNLNVDDLTFQLIFDNGCPTFTPYAGGAVNIPRTGQSEGRLLTLTEEDGDIQPGMPWPSPRFTDNGDNTITDNMTGLMWGKSVSSAYWDTAMQNCENLTLGEHSDWRMPNVREMRSLFEYGRYEPAIETGLFDNMPAASALWTSTGYPGNGYNYKYGVSSTSGSTYYYTVYNVGTYYSHYYLPVRSAFVGDVEVPKTGQSSSFSSRVSEDGDLQLGADWPNPRFTDHGDGTVTDNLTGIMWLKASSSFDTMWGGL
ncbi:MAG: DUF1566 domain-containing protein [Kiritimatiellales bacterium]|nr:DUF1566 domain-containing protein [Kiritimatiellales bacterium]